MVESFIRDNPELDSRPSSIVGDLAALLKILAEPNRLLILDLLMQGVQCNCEIGRNLQMTPNLVSHHINVLRQAELVDVERDATDARWIYFSINRDKLNELRELMELFFDASRIQSRRPDCGPERTLLDIQGATHEA
jgi:ArsR family transcriptional regulator